MLHVQFAGMDMEISSMAHSYEGSGGTACNVKNERKILEKSLPTHFFLVSNYAQFTQKQTKQTLPLWKLQYSKKEQLLNSNMAAVGWAG